jgi:hypothetical protein
LCACHTHWILRIKVLVVKLIEELFFLAGIDVSVLATVQSTLVGHGLIKPSLLIFLDTIINMLDPLSVFLQSLVKSDKRRHYLIVHLRLVDVINLNVEGYGQAHIEHILFGIVAMPRQLMKKGRFLCYNMMKFHMINHLFDITEVI